MTSATRKIFMRFFQKYAFRTPSELCTGYPSCAGSQNDFGFKQREVPKRLQTNVRERAGLLVGSTGKGRLETRVRPLSNWPPARSDENQAPRHARASGFLAQRGKIAHSFQLQKRRIVLTCEKDVVSRGGLNLQPIPRNSNWNRSNNVCAGF